MTLPAPVPTPAHQPVEPKPRRLHLHRNATPEKFSRFIRTQMERIGAEEMALVGQYERACARPRSRFLWGWVQNGLQVTAVPGIAATEYAVAHRAKFAGVLLAVVLDDVADEGATPAQVRAMCGAVFDGQPVDAVDESIREMTELAVHVARLITDTVQALPGHSSLVEFLEFDYRQLANGMHYAALTNRHRSAGNMTENTAYQCHNMHMLVSGMIDLMALPKIRPDELGILRELFYVGQRMGRIGNALTTWGREAAAGDTSSTIFPLAAEITGLSIRELAGLDPAALSRTVRQSGAEARLLGEWGRQRDKARDIALRVKSFSAHDYIFGLEQLLELHQASRGLK